MTSPSHQCRRLGLRPWEPESIAGEHRWRASPERSLESITALISARCLPVPSLADGKGGCCLLSPPQPQKGHRGNAMPRGWPPGPAAGLGNAFQTGVTSHCPQGRHRALTLPVCLPLPFIFCRTPSQQPKSPHSSCISWSGTGF